MGQLWQIRLSGHQKSADWRLSGHGAYRDSLQSRSIPPVEPPVAGTKCDPANHHTESFALRGDRGTFEKCLLVNKKWLGHDGPSRATQSQDEQGPNQGKIKSAVPSRLKLGPHRNGPGKDYQHQRQAEAACQPKDKREPESKEQAGMGRFPATKLDGHRQPNDVYE